MHMKSVVEQGFFHEFTLDNKALKTVVEFRYGDHRSRGRYDSLWSVLRPRQIGPLHVPP